MNHQILQKILLYAIVILALGVIATLIITKTNYDSRFMSLLRADEVNKTYCQVYGYEGMEKMGCDKYTYN